MRAAPRSIFDKVWGAHEVATREDGASLLWVDRHFVHEGSHHAFAKLRDRGARVAHPELTFGVADHYVPTRKQQSPEAAARADRMLDTLRGNARTFGFELFDMFDARQGIVHVIGPELGLTLPGTVIVCGDSHTSTHGAFGAVAFGIGATEATHVLASQTSWQKKPKLMRITFTGRLAHGVGAKDLALHWISHLGADGARGCAVEYAGPVVAGMSMEARMTLCNLSIEGGARFGLIAPDSVTFDYLRRRSFAPSGTAWDRAEAQWHALQSDHGAPYDREVTIDAAQVAPIVTWGTSPEDALPVTDNVPDPAKADSPDRAERIRNSLDYMGLVAGRPLAGTPVDQVFLGSCTNGRIEDLRMAATVLAGRRSRVPGLVSPGSAAVKVQAEQEGLDRIFVEAGLEWATSGCSMCVGMNGDIAAPGQRCASTTNRNFRGRQGPGVRTHIMSPAMVAAAAVQGCLCDARPLLAGRG